MQFSQLEVTDIYYRGIYEEFTNINEVCHLKVMIKTFNMRVDFLKNLNTDPKINFNFISEVSRN